MYIHYQKKKLQKQLSDASEIKRAFGVMAQRVSQRLTEIRASPSLAILMTIPKANCHLLTGDKNGEWALDVSHNFRMIFEIAHETIPLNEDGSIDATAVTEIRILKIEDYH